MAGNLRVKLNLSEFNRFRNSAEVVAILEEKAAYIADRATAGSRFHDDTGDPFRVTTVHNRSRAVTFVATANFDGILAESVDRTLSKAIE
jgi:hypothetical protein